MKSKILICTPIIKLAKNCEFLIKHQRLSLKAYALKFSLTFLLKRRTKQISLSIPGMIIYQIKVGGITPTTRIPNVVIHF